MRGCSELSPQSGSHLEHALLLPREDPLDSMRVCHGEACVSAGKSHHEHAAALEGTDSGFCSRDIINKYAHQIEDQGMAFQKE